MPAPASALHSHHACCLLAGSAAMVADLAKSGKSILLLGKGGLHDAWISRGGGRRNLRHLPQPAAVPATCLSLLHTLAPHSPKPPPAVLCAAPLPPCRPPGGGQDDSHSRDQPHAGR